MPKKYIIFVRDFQTSLFPQYIIIYVWNKLYQKILGVKARIAMANRKKMVEYFIPPADWESLQNNIFEKVKNDEVFIKHVAKKAFQSVGALNKFTYSSIYHRDLTQLPNSRLAAIYNRFFELDVDCYAYGNIIFSVEFGERAYFTNKLKSILLTRCPKDVELFYSELTKPSNNTIFQKQSQELLKLCLEIVKNKNLNRLFLDLSALDLEVLLKKRYGTTYRKFVKFTNSFHWLFYNWEGPKIEIHGFLAMAQDIIRRERVKVEYNSKAHELIELKKKQDKIMKQLKFDAHERWLVRMAQFTEWFQPYRKARQWKSCWHMEKYFREVGKRLNISPDQARYLTHYEMSVALKKGKADINMINRRREFFVYFFQGSTPNCLSNGEADKFFKNNVKLEKINKKKIFSGTAACLGKVKGIIKIVNNLEDAGKFDDREILVSYSTNPLLLPIMRKAKAILTEEGGLTCHAAIVSRELKIPCVVGISGLVSSLKNGDKVEVDANRGIVRKI